MFGAVRKLVLLSMVSLGVIVTAECTTLLSTDAASLNVKSPFGNPSTTFPTSPVKLDVIPIGSTPKAAVAEVKGLIAKYDIAGDDARNVAMGTNQSIRIYVASTPSDYKRALQLVGISVERATTLSGDTAGFTIGGSVVVPVFQNQSPSDMANTIAHELTHAIFNLDIGPLPSWLNEGLAVSNGMWAQARVQGTLAYGAYARQMASNVLDAVQNKQLMPLADDESAVYNAPYDVELQDWLSVQYLIQQDGYPSILSYFTRLKLGETEDDAFAHTFGMTFHTFNAKFLRDLRRSVTVPDGGVQITLSVPDSYHGSFQVLQHGSTVWQGVRLTPGTDTIRISAKGNLTGGTNLLSMKAAGLPDQETLYIDLKPQSPLTYRGKLVANAGFAINYSDGLYGYGNAWVTLENGQTVYMSAPTLFQVQLLQVGEINNDEADPVLKWLSGLCNGKGP